MKKKFIFALLIILIIAGFSAFWFYGEKIFSKDILKLEILAQESVKMGDEVEYTVRYKNNGDFVLENPRLIFELPEHSLTEDSKTRFTQSIKDIYPGEEDFMKFKGRLLGKEGDLKSARAWLSYTPKNLSARYEGETTFTTRIETVPITLDFDLPLKLEKGKEFTYSVNYFSNIDYPLENLSIKIDSVNGFDFRSSDPRSLDNFEWKIRALNKAQGGRVNIRGAINADTQTSLNFLARLGMWQDGSFIVIKETQKEVQVIQPQLFISLQINGSSDYIASSGEVLHYEIFLRNIGSSPFTDLFIISRLNSSAFDLSTVRSGQGEARANDGVIVFDSKRLSELKNLDPRQEVKVEFDVKLKDKWSFVDLEKNNMVIKNKVEVLDIGQEFNTKVNSRLELSQKAYHSNQGGIENSGPVPPQANIATEYTVNWQIKNYFNDVKNVKVRAILPQGVALTSKILPENQLSNFSLDSSSREIIWSVGDLLAETGISSTLPSLSFQISLTPNIFQKGMLAGLIFEAIITGEDQFTGVTIKNIVPLINTSLPDDPNNSGGGVVR